MASLRQPIDYDILLATATELIEEFGADGLTLTAIAKRLGVTQPALYNHVDGVNDIWRGLGILVRANLAAELTRACLGHSGASAVRAVANAWRSFGHNQPAMYAVTDRYPVAGDPDLEAAVDEVVSVLGAAVRGFGLSASQEVHAARTLRSALHGFVTFELTDGHPKPHEPDDTFDHLVEVLIVGFQALADGTLRPHPLAQEPRQEQR